MELKLNVSTTLLTRLTEAVERLSEDYRKVHAADLNNYERYTHPSTERGRVFYQNDQELYAAEQKAKEAQEAIEI